MADSEEPTSPAEGTQSSSPSERRPTLGSKDGRTNRSFSNMRIFSRAQPTAPRAASPEAVPSSKSPRKPLLRAMSRSGDSSLSSSPSGRSPSSGKGIESIQKLVSKNKRRFVDKEHGFNLDLSYIGDRIIAMGFPSEGKEAAFRNPRSEVKRFLDTFHKDHYKVYNLCSERTYDAAVFEGRVAHYPFDDHNAPPLHLLYECCRDIDVWMKMDPKNVCAIHCKAGKGRTGVVIASWLQYNNDWPDADKALAFYAAARTYNQKGVTIPSQLRYVRYFGESLHRKGGYEAPPPKTLLLKEIVLRDFVSPGELRWAVHGYGLSGLNSLRTWKDAGSPLSQPAGRKDSQDVSYALHPPLPLHGDVRLTCSGKPVQFHFWISTAMVAGSHLTLPKAELDDANKDKKKVYPPGFNVTLVFSEQEGAARDTLASKKRAVGADSIRKKMEYRFPSLFVL